jgi:adenylate cyclase
MSYIFQIGAGASQDRLEKLIERRLRPDADKKAIDARIWDLFGETWAIMFTDLSGFSRRSAEFGITHFLQTIYESQRLLVPVIDDHDGILLKVEGDSMVVIFRDPGKALECAIRMQQLLGDYNKERAEEEQVLLCVGLGYGEMLRIGDADVFGAQVNAAAKLGEDTAQAWEILVTEAVQQTVGGKPGLRFEQIDYAPPGAVSAYRVHYPAG